MAPDRELQAAIIAAGEIKSESRELRDAIREFADLLHRGLIRSTVQGLAMIVVGIMLAITFLGLLSQTWSCDAGNLAQQKGSLHYKACAVIFPQIVPQVAGIQKAAIAAKVQADQATQVNEGIALLRDMKPLLDDVQGRLKGTSPTATRICAILRKLDPKSPDLKGCL